jgi:hypothetical protein
MFLLLLLLQGLALASPLIISSDTTGKTESSKIKTFAFASISEFVSLQREREITFNLMVSFY